MLVEANIPAAQSSPASDARIPEADEERGRKESPQQKARKGPQAAHRLDPPDSQSRLRHPRDFELLYKKGTAARGSLMVLILRWNGLERVRVGVVAGRKVGNAVKRNRCKRLLREGYYTLRREGISEGLDLLLIARAGCSIAGIDQVREEMRVLYAQAVADCAIRSTPGCGNGKA